MRNDPKLTAADQATYSAATFLWQIGAALILDAATYGAFAHSYAVAVLLVSISHAACLEWAIARAGTMVGAEKVLLSTLTLPLTTLMICSGALLSPILLAQGIDSQTAVLTTSFCVLTIAIVAYRRMHWIRDDRSRVLAASTGYLGAIAITLSACWIFSASSASTLFGIASVLLITLVVPMAIDHIRLVGRASTSRHEIALLARYAAWAVPTVFIFWLPLNAPVVYLSASGNATDAGVLKGALNLVTPWVIVFGAAGTWTIRRFSEVRSNLVSEATKLLLVFVAIGSLGSMFVLIGGIAAFKYLYAFNAPEVNALLFVLAPIPALYAALSVPVAYFRHTQMPKAVFTAYAIGALGALALWAILTIVFRCAPSAFLMAGISSFTFALVLAALGTLFFRQLRNLTTSNPHLDGRI